LNVHMQFISKRVDTEEEFIKALTHFLPDLIICDQSLPRFDAFSAMNILKRAKLEIPFLLVTGTVSDEDAMDYLRWGAYDYILKANLSRLPFAVKNALVAQELSKQKQYMEHEHVMLKRNHLVSSEKNKNITDSMIYAKDIQTALLPKQNYIHQYFPQSFLINMPKDIVSGDFYWFSKYEGKFVIAVGDCTGHGVPAALISMIGYNKLNYIVNKLGETNPAKILAHLNVEIRDVFQQDDQETAIRDGMDIAICTIDSKTDLLEFSGANRPLYFVKDNSLEVIKGDKKCIGGIWNKAQEFTCHSLPVSDVRGIYLFTDGFLDQFGGQNGKKFLSKRFKNILSVAKEYAMKDQRNLLVKTINEWRGEAEQTDDICVLGIRF
jgi:serine phosphatase RsbU (regulator of sigma subunit)